MYFKGKIFIHFFVLLKIVANIRLAKTVSTQSRTLIFPPTTPTRVQFICGIGIPVEDLRYESITSGYVLKTEYFLPTNATQLHMDFLKPQTIHRRSFSNNNRIAEKQSRRPSKHTYPKNAGSKYRDLSTYRWIIYKAMEQLAERIGLPGKACVLKSICEVASAPFHYASGILAEVVHIVMTPTASSDVINHRSGNEYIHAEILGRTGASCSHEFKECQESLIQRISNVNLVV